MKLRLFLLLVPVIIGCRGKEIHIEDKTIQKLSKYNLELPSADIGLFLFVKSNDGRLWKVNIHSLKQIYRQYYASEYETFDIFLFKSLNQKIRINSRILAKKNDSQLTLNNLVTKDYEVLDTVGFLNKYCIPINSNTYEIKRQYKEMANSIQYFLFIDNYSVTADDYLGRYLVIKD